MKKSSFPVIIEQDEDGIFIASVPSLPGCYTQAKSLSSLRVRIKDAIQLYIIANPEALKGSNFLKFISCEQIDIDI
jgi:predicted RNase H-like HicB family nuclease